MPRNLDRRVEALTPVEDGALQERLAEVLAIELADDELAGLLPTVLAQSAPLDVLVLDDGSTDGTAELVRHEFPSVRLDRVERSLGLIAQRNRARPPRPHPDHRLRGRRRPAAVPGHRRADPGRLRAPPHRGGRHALRRRPPRAGGQAGAAGRRRIWVTDTFVGTAHAIRRDLFLAAGGYRVELGRGVEEPELSLRLLALGAVVRLGRADPLHHLESPRRAGALNERLIWRNNWRAAWWDVPWPHLAVRALKLAATTPVVGARVGRPWSTARGMVDGLRLAPSDLRDPAPGAEVGLPRQPRPPSSRPAAAGRRRGAPAALPRRHSGHGGAVERPVAAHRPARQVLAVEAGATGQEGVGGRPSPRSTSSPRPRRRPRCPTGVASTMPSGQPLAAATAGQCRSRPQPMPASAGNGTSTPCASSRKAVTGPISTKWVSSPRGRGAVGSRRAS